MMSLEGKKCIVTGGAGFVGTHLTRALLRQGAVVTVVDDLSTGHLNTSAQPTGEQGNASFIQHDICQPIDLRGDILFNLACPASPKHYQRDPLQTWKTSVLGAMHLGEMAVENNLIFVQASTSEVYGDPQVHPQSETYWGNVCTKGIRACYDEGKRAAETYLTDLSRMRGLDLRIARIFNTYGAGMAIDDGRAVSNFALQALQGDPLTVFGDGSQTRSLCYVHDLVDGLIAMALNPSARGEIMNLGNPREHTVREIADLVLEVAGLDVALEFCPLPQHDPMRRCPDIAKARRVLGWSPKIEIHEGLSLLITDFKARLAAGETLAPF
ncbi:MAG: GDP-mannose 4,6-dehydratase [Sulfitobacter sp.]|nr:GDP-mannose 4,6-dehydratase [Sulfitobacter sp.]